MLFPLFCEKRRIFLHTSASALEYGAHSLSTNHDEFYCYYTLRLLYTSVFNGHMLRTILSMWNYSYICQALFLVFLMH